MSINALSRLLGHRCPAIRAGPPHREATWGRSPEEIIFPECFIFFEKILIFALLNNNYMRKLLFLTFVILMSLNLMAQLEVKDGSFKEVPGFVNINPDENYQKDDNDLPFAIIKVRTENINDKQRRELKFSGNAGTFVMLEYKDGEVWVYITAKHTDYLKISHPDFSSIEFALPYDLQPKKGYELTIVNKQSVDEDVMKRLERLEDVVITNQTSVKVENESGKNKNSNKEVPVNNSTINISSTETQHLTFKGVPIDGTLKEYIEAMKKAGFIYKEKTSDGGAILTGDFAGYKNCRIKVSTLNNCDVVNRIFVQFLDNDTWSSLIIDYENLKNMLIKKYGKPKNSSEKFTSYVSGSNDSKMIAIHNGEHEWYTLFSTDLGNIVLSITEGVKSYTGAVSLTYYDKINSDKVQNAAIDDL